jgi:hypothetical protein
MRAYKFLFLHFAVKIVLTGSLLFGFGIAIMAQEIASDPGHSDAQSQQPAVANSTAKTRLQHPVHIVPLVMPATQDSIKTGAVLGASVSYFGGPVISNVHVVAVLYGTGNYLPNISSTNPPSIASFFTDVPVSSLFDMLTEYNTLGVVALDGAPGSNQTIGHGFFDGQFTITPAAVNNGAVITDAQIQTELESQVAAGKLPQPVLDAQGNSNTLYMIFFPVGKTITLGDASSCQSGGFCAYHSSTRGSNSLLYGVMPDMQAPSLCSQGCGAGSPFDIVTNVASHELSEAITDANVGNANIVGRPLAWFDPFNGEIGDICQPNEATISANGHTYTVQQEFSQLQNICAVAPPEFVFQSPPTKINSGVEFQVPVFLRSGQGGPFTFAGAYNGTVHFTSSDPTAVLPPDYTFNSADKAFHVFVFTLNTPGNNQTITITDAARPLLTGSTSAIAVASPAVSQFTVAAPATAVPGSPVAMVVTALDANLNRVTSFQGPIHFSSSDSAAVLPPDSTLTDGIGTFSATFNTLGIQTLSVQDAATGKPSTLSRNIKVFTPGANTTNTTVSVATNPYTFTDPALYTATVTAGGKPVVGRVVSFTIDGTFTGSTVTDNSGQGQFFLSFLLPGLHTVFAEFEGDSFLDSSSSTPLAVTLNRAPTTIGLKSLNPSAVFGTPVNLDVTFSAPITTPTGVFPTGSFTFRDGGNPISLFTNFLPGLQGVTLSVIALTVGSHNITVDYSGDANFAPSTTAAITQVITPAPAANYSIQPDKSSVTVSAGQSATFILTSTSVNGFSGDIQLTCSNLPALAKCNFVPPLTLLAANSTVTTKLIVQTTGPHAALSQPPRQEHYSALQGPGILGSLLLCGIVLVGARRRNLGIQARFLLLFAAVVFASSIISCGGGGSASNPTPTPPGPTPTTPSGTTTFSVSADARPGAASPGAANPKQQLNISITVQP